MHYMTLVEETESEHKTCLKFWRNLDDEIYFQMGYENDEDPMMTQAMVLDIDDCEVLIGELQRIICEIKGVERNTPHREMTEGVERNDGTPLREMTPPPAEPKKKKPQPAPLFKFQNDLNGNLTKVS